MGKCTLKKKERKNNHNNILEKLREGKK